ncbi:MAG: FtsH protease activity modulator HflK [Thermodesulfobacteriota bacterium]
MKNDNRTERPEVSKKASGEEDVKEARTSWTQWKERFTGVVQQIFLVSGTLGKKGRGVYLHIFKPKEGVGPIDDIKGAFKHIPLRKRWVGYTSIGFVLAVYLLSGVYTVEPGEEAVARVFGKEVREQITEGLHYHLPWPFEAVEKVNVMEIRRVDVGVPLSGERLLFPKKGSSSPASAAEEHGGHGMHGAHSQKLEKPRPNPVSAENQFLTGDENILEIKMNIQYRIKDASDYLFNVNYPDSLVPDASRAAVTEILGGMRVDDLLTVAKSQIQKMIAHKVQKMLDEYRSGLYILNVILQEVNPPNEAAQAFRDVASAKEEREEKINKAQGYWNAVIPEARGKAHKMISDAEGYREEAVNLARGDAEKFSAMLREYRRAKDVTAYRLYMETVEKIFAKAKKFIIDSKKERVNLKFVK